MKITALPLLALLFLISSCTKNYDVPASTSVVAKGNGSNAYLPLSVGDTWNYYPTWATTVTAKTAANVYTINENYSVSNVWLDSIGDYVMQSTTTSPVGCAGVSVSLYAPRPYLYIPATPTAGQTWTDTVANGILLSAKVISTNATIATSIYGYTGCLEVSYLYTYNVGTESGSVTLLKYFSKGVGVVYTTTTINDYSPTYYNLNNFIVN